MFNNAAAVQRKLELERQKVVRSTLLRVYPLPSVHLFFLGVHDTHVRDGDWVNSIIHLVPSLRTQATSTEGLFKPRLATRSESVERSRPSHHDSSTSSDVGERLFNEAKKATERRRQLQLKVAQEEQQRVRSTSVQRSRTPAPRDRDPLYSPSLLRQKAEMLESRRAAVELSECTFRPQIRESGRSSSVPRSSTGYASPARGCARRLPGVVRFACVRFACQRLCDAPSVVARWY